MFKLYNSLTRKKEVFKPIHKAEVRMYNCGPTVYNYIHLGNLRSFLFADLLRRYLEYKEYKVRQVMNITDVGHMIADADIGKDKLEVEAKKEKKTPQEIAKFYEKAFFEDINKLNIKRAWKYPRATEHIKEMIELVKKLLKNGYAYEVNGSVYFDVTKFKNYGKLSGNTLEQLQAGKRVCVRSEKKNPWDFALWVYDPKHIMYWKSPWNNHGYPGWHLECSTMSMKYLGETFDIHTGGEDNKFPHHECEIAQSEGATGKRFVNYWLHVKHLIVEGKKMSKSLGNFYTLRDLLNKGYSPRAIRYLLISTHYRQQLNFTFKSLNDAQCAVDKIDEFVRRIHKCYTDKTRTKSPNNNLNKLIQQAKQSFEKVMDDDLNISKGLAVIFDFIHQVNKWKATPRGAAFLNHKSAKKVEKFILQIDKVLGLNLAKISQQRIKIPEEIKKLVDKRKQARKNKDWDKADKLRKKIEDKGFLVEDTPVGPKIKVKK